MHERLFYILNVQACRLRPPSTMSPTRGYLRALASPTWIRSTVQCPAQAGTRDARLSSRPWGT
eukprot:9317048-Pyramimonas_sp.AAC.1